MKPSAFWSRRRFVTGLVVAVAALAYPVQHWLRSWRGRLLRQWHEAKPGAQLAPPTAALQAVAIFAGALHGHDVDEAGGQDLIERFRFATQVDAAWGEEYTALARYLDRTVRRRGADSFVAASRAQRAGCVDDLMTLDPTSTASELKALYSSTERDRRRIRSSTIPHLSALYRKSSVPWRIRGYQNRWPGHPDDARAYTRAGPMYPCPVTS